MSKREFNNSDDDELVHESEERLPFNKKFKHTLDSDESDDELQDDTNKYKLIEGDAMDGEEEGELHREDEITITPFNIKDELKEGHFDSDGMYIFKKNQEEIKDNWIDNIDWVKIKETGVSSVSKLTNRESDDDEPVVKLKVEECFRKLIELMNPNETVQKAIQRLGKSKLKNANRNKNRQRAKQSNQASLVDSQEEEEEKERKEKLNSLLELSNQLLSDGDMNIYETKYETLKYRLEEKEKKEEIDMFGD